MKPTESKIMTRILLLLVLLLVAVPAMAGTAFTSKDELNHWLTYYYLKPDPNRVPEAVKYMSEIGLFDDKKGIAPFFGFLSGVFRKNPTRMPGWVDQMSSMKEAHLGVVILGLWYSDQPKAQQMAFDLLAKHRSLQADYGFIHAGPSMPIEMAQMTMGPWVIDALWGKFFATGDAAPIKRIISVLQWADSNGDPNRAVIGNAANWSLTSNAAQHKRVLKICETAAKAQSRANSVKLVAVIDDAKRKIQAQQAQRAQ